MLTHLFAAGPHPTLPPELDLYAPLLGGWEVSDGDRRRTWEFARILDGLGIQDVLRDHGTGHTGATVRIFDRELRAWRVWWHGPVPGESDTLIARRGPTPDSIHQEGHDLRGRPIRWDFSGIGPASFRWDGFQDGTLVQQMAAVRTR